MAIFKGLKKNEKYDIYQRSRHIGRDVVFLAEGGVTGRDAMARDDWKIGDMARLAGSEEPVAVARRRKMRGKEYIVMDASTCPSLKCWGVYRRVAVVLVDWAKLPADRELPTMISEHARGVVEVVRTWENCNVGTTKACAFELALAEARKLAARLNGQA